MNTGSYLVKTNNYVFELNIDKYDNQYAIEIQITELAPVSV